MQPISFNSMATYGMIYYHINTSSGGIIAIKYAEVFIGRLV